MTVECGRCRFFEFVFCTRWSCTFFHATYTATMIAIKKFRIVVIHRFLDSFSCSLLPFKIKLTFLTNDTCLQKIIKRLAKEHFNYTVRCLENKNLLLFLVCCERKIIKWFPLNSSPPKRVRHLTWIVVFMRMI